MRQVKVMIGELKQGERYRCLKSDGTAAPGERSVVLNRTEMVDWLAQHAHQQQAIPVVSYWVNGTGVLAWNSSDTEVLVERPNLTYEDLVPGDQFRFVGEDPVFRKLSVGYMNPKTWENFGG